MAQDDSMSDRQNAADSFDHVFMRPRDWDASMSFYWDSLGWAVEHEWGDRSSGRGAALRSPGNFRVVLAEAHAAATDSSQDPDLFSHQPAIYLSVRSVDERRKALAGSSHVVVEPEDTHWGVRWTVLKDPDGNLVVFVSKPGR